MTFDRAMRGAAPEYDEEESRREDADTARLVVRVQAGEDHVFAALYERYFDRVYAYLRVMLRDSHEAEDATQQVFVKVFEAIDGYEPRGPFRAWLFTIVRNYAITQLRKRGRVELRDANHIQDDHEEAVGADPATLSRITDRDLVLFIELLPELQRQVVMMRYVLGFTPSEIGEALGRSPNAISALQRRALRSLEQRLVAIGRAPESRRRGRAPIRRWRPQAHVLRSRRFALSP